MPKQAGLLLACLLASFLANACSSQSTAPGAKNVPGEPAAGPAAPGMIPAECEALLNQSKAWGYLPGQAWKADSQERMLEVAAFFGGFRLVPAETSEELRRYAAGGPAPGHEAQVCDPFLAQAFLDALVSYRWGKAERLEASRQLHQFFLNQQALTLPILHRVVAANALVKAVRAGLMPGPHARAQALKSWMEKELQEIPAQQEGASSGEELLLLRRQLALSERIRHRVGELLPLP